MRFVLFLVLLSTQALAMDIKPVGDQLIMSGRINGGELARLRDVLAEYGESRIHTVILRDSPGGDHWESLRVGEFIRDRGWRTAVSGTCSSGCALMFMGGVARHFTDDKPESQTRVSFHGSYSPVDTLRARAGGRNWEDTSRSVGWIKERSDGKLSEALLDRIAMMEKHEFLRFTDPSRTPKAGMPSVFHCVQPEKSLPRKCDPVEGTDSYREGIITSKVLLRSNDRADATTR